MKKLIVDVSSVIGQFLHIPDEECGTDMTYNGEKFHIPSPEVTLEKVENHFQFVLDRFELGPEDLIMVKDPEQPGIARKRMYPEYKAGRTKRPPAFYSVFNEVVGKMCEMVMKAGGVCATPRVVPSAEADDLINEFAARFPGSIVWAQDKDLLACPAGTHYIDNQVDPVKFPVPRRFIRLYRCLVTGDASDNVPGCKGFGPAAWEKMLQLIDIEGLIALEAMIAEPFDKDNDSLFALKDDVSAFKPFQKIIDQAEMVKMSYKLMGFLPVPAHKIFWEARTEDCEKVLITKTNFHKWERLIKQQIDRAPHTVIDFETDIPEEHRETSLTWIEGTQDDSGKGGVKVDIMASEITGMGLKVGTHTYYFSVDHADTENLPLSDLEKVLSWIGPKRTYAHNSTGFENVMLFKTFKAMLPGMVDTMLMANYVDENSFNLGLKNLSKIYLNYEQETYAAVLAGRPGMRHVTGEEVVSYGIDDVITADGLQRLFQIILQYEGSLDAFNQVEVDSAFVTSLAFFHGVDFDWEVHTKLKAENDANIARAEKELETLLLAVGFGEPACVPFPMLIKAVAVKVYEAMFGEKLVTNARSVGTVLKEINAEIETLEKSERRDKLEELSIALREGLDELNTLHLKYWKPRAELNVNSPTQMRILLYDTLGCPVRITRAPTDKMREAKKAGNPATDELAVKNAIHYKDCSPEGVTALEKMTELKGYMTRESLFLAKYPSMVHWQTGKLHSSMRQSSTTTRRFSHSSPQLAQMPKKKGKEVRDMVKAEEDEYLVALDYDSQELKLQAWDSQCPAFLSAYTGKVKKDIHAMTGFHVAGMQEINVGTFDEFVSKIEGENKPFRADGKATNFSTAYLCKARKLSHMLCVDEELAQKFIDAKALAFPGLMPHIERWIALCKERRYSTTFMGAVRHLARAFAGKSDGEQGAAGRLAWSFRIQSSGAEMIKCSMGYAWRSGVFNDSRCKPVTVIHDELVCRVKKVNAAEKIRLLHAAVCIKYADMGIELTSTPKVGTNLGSMKEWDVEKGDFK